MLRPSPRMNHSPDDETVARLVQQVFPGSIVQRIWPLSGGISAMMRAVAVQGVDGRSQTVIVRTHGRTADCRQRVCHRPCTFSRDKVSKPQRRICWIVQLVPWCWNICRERSIFPSTCTATCARWPLSWHKFTGWMWRSRMFVFAGSRGRLCGVEAGTAHQPIPTFPANKKSAKRRPRRTNYRHRPTSPPCCTAIFGRGTACGARGS